jgi:hypothetical protein
MKITFTHPTKLLALLAVSGSLLLSACGSGNNTSTTAATVELSGIAATGAPMSGATIVVTDKTGAEVQNCPSACVASDSGSFLIPLKAGAQAPFVLRATPVGGGEPQVSVVPEATSTNVNITPITTMIAGRLAPDGDPANLSASAFDGEKLKAAAKEIVDLLKPLLDAMGTTTDPLTGKFAADGTGLDRVLDSLNVQIQRNASGQATIEIEVKVNGDDAVPPKITIAPNTTPTSTVNSTNVTSTNVVAAGVSVQLANFVSRMSTCWNTPHSSRVDNTTNPTTVTATVCKGLFVGDEPGNYKSNGKLVGPNGSFSGMYKNRGTVTVTFDRPVYEFTRNNGDVVMSYHWSNSLGDEDHDRLVVRIVNGVAKAIGNQYDYDADVKPIVQKRTYNESTSGAMNHFATGYTLYIRNHTDVNGSATFSKVVVTSPRGNTMTLFPSSGSERMVFKDRNGILTNTPVMRLQWKYDSTNSNLSTNGTDLADVETTLVFARTSTGTATPWTDEQIKAIPNIGRWQFVFHDRVSGLPVATQTHSTISRAQTVEEARGVVWPELTAATITDINSGISSTLGGIQISNEVVDLTNTDGSAVWQVGTGAWAPTSASAFTRLSGKGYTDSSSFRSTTRSTTISCSRASGGDTHCDTGVQVGGSGTFATGVVVNGLELWGRSARFVDRSRFYAFYPRNPNPAPN